MIKGLNARDPALELLVAELQTKDVISQLVAELVCHLKSLSLNNHPSPTPVNAVLLKRVRTGHKCDAAGRERIGSLGGYCDAQFSQTMLRIGFSPRSLHRHSSSLRWQYPARALCEADLGADAGIRTVESARIAADRETSVS